MSGDSATSDRQVLDREAGYFGKMPVRGDFLSLGLPPAFIDPWEDWIRVSLATSRQQIDESWLDYYLTSPIWHFTLSTAICGDAAWVGIIMPSVDAVGRYFPLTIAAPVTQETGITTLLDNSKTWFMKAERLARSCLDDDFDITAFEEAIVLLGAPDYQTQDSPVAQITGGDCVKNGWHFSSNAPDDLSQVYPRLLRKMLNQLCASYSLWWTAGSASVAPTFLMTQGLPPPDGYAALLDGDWRRWGWNDL